MGFLFSKFQNWKRKDYIKAGILPVEPMSAIQEEDEEKLAFYYNSDQWVAEEKIDGERVTLHFHDGYIRAFSRYVSKKSDWYTENTDSFPHIRDFMFEHFEDPHVLDGTIIDGEFKIYGGEVFKDSSSLLSCKWDEAQRRQKNSGVLMQVVIFDIIYYKGNSVENSPYHERKQLLHEVWQELVCEHLIFHPYRLEKKEEYYNIIVNRGGEGIMLKNVNMPYEHKRSKWMVKVKKFGFWDCVVMGFEPPTKEYSGKTNLADWPYWEDKKPVTKYHFNKWIGKLIFGVYKNGELVEVGRCSGFNEDLRERMSKNPDKYIGRTIVVKAQEIISNKTGSLRHPRYEKFREDKPAKACTFKDHLLNRGGVNK